MNNTKRIAAIAIGCVLVGAAGAFWWQSSRNAFKKPVREEFVPAQDLSLTGRAGTPLGRVDVSDGLVTLYLYTDEGGSYVSASVYSDSSRVYVNCVGNQEGTGIIVGLNRTDVSDLKRGYVFGEWKDLTAFDRLLISFLPSRGLRFDDSWVVPTEDLHLRNREGWVFGSLGLAANGDPGIALADARGTVRAAWFERGQLGKGELDGWDLAVWDKAGVMRLSLQLRPEESPNLVSYADKISTQYVLDFASHRLMPRDDAHPSVLTWLPAMKTLSREPIQLADNRGHKLWSSSLR
jgi:hypothetical protein